MARLQDLPQAIEQPLREFVRQSGVELAVVTTRSGQVLAQHGFARALDLMGVAALAAGIHAATRALAEQLGQPPFGQLHHAGVRRQLFVAPIPVPGDEFIFLGVFDERSSLGLVQVFFEDFAHRVRALPHWSRPPGPAGPEDFERALRESLDRFFHRLT